MTVFYFSATGNSLYVAKRIGGRLISIPQILKSGERVFTDDMIGIIFPCYSGGIPRIVMRFLDQVELKAKYCFAIITFGNESTDVIDQIRKYSVAKGIRLDYLNTILMVNNYLPMFKIEEELNKAPRKGIEKAIAAVIDDIQERKQYIPSSGFSSKFWGAIFRSGANKITRGNVDQRFTIDKKCSHCHICTKVCPVGNINLNENHLFGHQCEGCLSCIHHCPNGAIHIKGEKSAKRFLNSNIKLEDIITANMQQNSQ